MRVYLKEIIELLGADKKRVPRMIVLFLFISILDVAGIGLIGPYITAATSPDKFASYLTDVNSEWVKGLDSTDLLIVMSMFLVLVFVIKTLVGIWINYIIVRFSADQLVRLRSYLMEAYQKLPYVIYLERNSSEYINSIQVLVNHYANGVIASGLRAISDAIVGFSILILLFIVDPLALMLMVTMLGLLIYSYDYFFKDQVKKLGIDTNNAAKEIIQGIHEGVEGLKENRVLGVGDFFYRKVRSNAIIHGRCHSMSTVISTAPRYVLEVVLVLFIVTIVLVNVFILNDPDILLPTVGMFGVASIRLLPAANMISSSLMQVRFSRDSVAKLHGDLKLLSEYDSSSTIIENRDYIFDRFKSLQLKKVYFRYPRSKHDALYDVSMKIHSGESIGIIGISGSGKTTLIDMLLGLLDPSKGSIQYNGTPLENSINDWRKKVAYLPQQVFLVDDTVKKNIALGVEEKNINLELLMQSIQKAQIYDLVRQLPNGIDTMIGERGMRLSGGQRQRMALARAFYHEREVIVMDESTSALDHETEQEIVEEIKQLKGQKTLIVIAHRLSTIQHCDKIIKLDNGKVVEISNDIELS
jgi:ATP-binding cassette, subfamily B, bacterial PglK